MKRVVTLLCVLGACGCNLFEDVSRPDGAADADVRTPSTDAGSDTPSTGSDTGFPDDAGEDTGVDLGFNCDQQIADFCADYEAECGNLTAEDACGTMSTAHCGECTTPETCGGGGTPNQCGCATESDEEFCTRQGFDCGPVTAPDNCGEERTVDCGTCSAPAMCGANEPNVCGCVEADLCGFFGVECGVEPTDACPDLSSVDCGSCGMNSECTDGECVPEFTGAVGPVEIDGAASCQTTEYLARHIAIDEGQVLYAAFHCGGTVKVSRSDTAGATWDDPVDTGITGGGVIAITAGASDHVYVTATDSTDVQFTHSTDGGASWSASHTFQPTSVGSWLSLAEHDGTVFLAYRDDGKIRVHRDVNGAGVFDSVLVDNSNAYADVLVDDGSGDVYIVGDSPTVEAALSDDDGQSFGPTLTPGETLYYSDWAFGNGEVFGLGDSDLALSELALIVGDPADTFRGVTGFDDAANPSDHALCVASDGTAYVVFQATDGLKLQRVSAGADTADAAVTIDADGDLASCVATPNGFVAVVYTANGEVFATLL